MGSARFLDPSSIPLKRQSGGNIWATLVLVTQGVTVVVLLSGLMLFFLPVIQKTRHLQDEKASLLRSIADAQDQQQKLKIQTEHLKSDPAYVEHISRDQLNLGRPGETIMLFDPYQAIRPAPKTVQAVPENDSKADSN